MMRKIKQFNGSNFAVENFGVYENPEEAWAEVWDAIFTYFGDWSAYDVYDIETISGYEHRKAFLYNGEGQVVRHVSIGLVTGENGCAMVKVGLEESV